MKKILKLALALSLGFSPCLKAEELKDIFGRVQQMVEAKNYTKALDELGWAKKEIEKLNTAQLKTFFPDTLNGYSGDKFEANSILGISNVERTYKKEGAGEIKVSLTGGSGGAAQGGFGGLAALGGMAAMMGGQEGSDTFRIDGRTATLSLPQGSSNGELTVFLNSGSILKVEMFQKANGDTLKAMAQALKLNDLDNYLKGAS